MDDLGDDKGGWIGVVGASDGPWWWWRIIPFSSSMILPFEEVLVNFNRWNRKRSENEEDWALRDVFW